MSPSKKNDDPIPHKRLNQPCREQFPPNNNDAAQHRRKRASTEDKRFVLVSGQNAKITILISTLPSTSAELLN